MMFNGLGMKGRISPNGEAAGAGRHHACAPGWAWAAKRKPYLRQRAGLLRRVVERSAKRKPVTRAQVEIEWGRRFGFEGIAQRGTGTRV